MAQLRHDYDRFQERDAVVIAIGPESREKLAEYWTKHELPFVGVPDPEHVIANSYGQEVKIAAGGRMPALLVVDKTGRVRYEHYGKSMRDIPRDVEILALLDHLNQETAATSPSQQLPPSPHANSAPHRQAQAFV